MGIVAAAVLGAVGGWLWSRWRKGRQGRNGPVEIDGAVRTRPRTGVYEVDGWERPCEADATPKLYEAGGRERPCEADAEHRVYELSGG